MFKALFNIIINLLATLVQVVLSPLNLAVSSAFPDFTDKVSDVTNTLSTVFNGMGWALGMVPPVLLGVLIFIVTCEIAKHTVFISTHALIKVWNLFQKLKFW